MIGILYNTSKEKDWISFLVPSLESLFKDEKDSLVLFTMDGLDLETGRVKGYLFNNTSVQPYDGSLPPFIYNFSVQYRRQNIRKLRKLLKDPYIHMMNETNRFHQPTIMNILSSSKESRQYLLAYEKPNRVRMPGTLMISAKGTSAAQIYYIEKGLHGIPYQVKPAWMSLGVPDLLTSDGLPLVDRVYTQRERMGTWTVWDRMSFPKNTAASSPPSMEITQDAVITMMSSLSNFIPHLAICHMDLVYDMKGRPYFLRLGGWDDRIITSTKQFSPLQDHMWEKLLHHPSNSIRSSNNNNF